VWLRQRMEGGRWHLARKGEYRLPPPAGFAYEDEESHRLTLDPDEEICRSVRLLFERYRTGGSNRDVVRYFAANNLKFPSRHAKRVVWNRLTPGRVRDVLINPLYAGAYVFGRIRRETILVEGIRHTRRRAVPQSEWPVMIHDAHSAYIS